MKSEKRWLGLLAALCLLASLFPTASAAGESPYYIKVDRKANVVTVYGKDEAGEYTSPVRIMLCSVGREGHSTPTGEFKITSYRREWLHMVDNSYGQYAVQFKGNYLFHSVCYSAKSPSTLLTEEYNSLGSAASLGCVRLQVEDAKWIYDNCPAGTAVTIFDGEETDPPGKPQRRVDHIDEEDPKSGWDPTDPRAENPWAAWQQENTLPFPDVSREDWFYDDALLVYKLGLMRGVTGGGFAPEMPLSRAMAVQMLCKLSGTDPGPAPRAGLWYLPALQWAIDNRVAEGVSVTDFQPDKAITRQELMVFFYRYETGRRGARPQSSALLSSFTDAEEIDLFAGEAMRWGVSTGLIQGDGAGHILPNGEVTRAQAAAVFRRYYELMENER